MPSARRKPKTPPKPKNVFVEGWEDRIAGSPPPIVRVTWLDAGADCGTVLETPPGWEQRYDTYGCVMQSVGYLLAKTEKWVILAPECHLERNSGFRRMEHIPTYSVCELVTLEG
jgi:hypothetical protein